MYGRFDVDQELRQRAGRKELKAHCKLTGVEVFLEAIDKDWLAANKLYSVQKGKELKCASLLHHEGFLKVVDSFQDQSRYFIATEWAEGGSLSHLIKKKGSLKEYLVLWFAIQLIEAIADSHAKGVILGNLNSRKLFIKDSHLKIGRLDHSLLHSEVAKAIIPANGHSLTIAPEVLKGANYSFKADIWSLGVVLFEMLYGTTPLLESTLAKLKTSFELFSFSNKESDLNPSRRLLGHILEGLLVVDTSKRWSLAQLIYILPQIRHLLDSHAIIGLKIDINAIEYYCDPVLSRVESLKGKRMVESIQNLVDQNHQINNRFKTDTSMELKWARLDFKWMLNLLLFSIQSFKNYQKVIKNQLLNTLLSTTLICLLEFDRLLSNFQGSPEQMSQIHRKTADEKSLVLGLGRGIGDVKESCGMAEGLQR
jgi:serine/threonine protein kinase